MTDVVIYLILAFPFGYLFFVLFNYLIPDSKKECLLFAPLMGVSWGVSLPSYLLIALGLYLSRRFG